MIALAVAGAVILLLVILFIALYNGMVRRRNAVDNAWSQIEVQLKRRHDLIPNLVETVKGYASHEQRTLQAVVAARGSAIQAQDDGTARQRAEAENALTGALRQLFAVAEGYPTLNADQNFLGLQEELATTENRIAYARQYYNNAVLTYNNSIQTVPSNMVAGMSGFRPREYFESPDESAGPVQVRF